MSDAAYIITEDSLTIYRDGDVATATSDDAHWEALVKAVGAEEWDIAFNLIHKDALVAAYTGGVEDVEVRDGVVLWQGRPMHGALVDRILKMEAQGFNTEPMVKFLANLQENPSYSSREQLYAFLAANQMPLTSDGCFLAYKRIREDWMDCFSGTIDNSLGVTVTMPRGDVDDDPNRTCSAGLHVCSLEYLKHYWGARLVAVKVNPKHVVSVPVDYNNSKMRVSEYVVESELPFELVGGEKEAWDRAVVDSPWDKTEKSTPGYHVIANYASEDVGFMVITPRYWGYDEWVTEEADAELFDTAEDAQDAVMDYVMHNGENSDEYFKVEYVSCENSPWDE